MLRKSLLIVVFACAACGGGGGDEGPDPTTLPGAEQVVGAAGGTVTVTEGPLVGTTVDIPAGALTSDVTITIGGDNDIFPEGREIRGTAIRLGPAGTTFAIPVTVTIPYTGSSEELKVAHRDQSGMTTFLTNVAADEASQMVSFTLDSFSTVQAMAEIGAKAVIGPEGGTLRIDAGRATGSEVYIPPGALSESVEISVFPDDTFPLEGWEGATAIKCRPAGLQFAVPVEVTLTKWTLITETPEAYRFAVAQRSAEDVVTIHTELDVQDGQVTATVTSFSTFQTVLAAGTNTDVSGRWLLLIEGEAVEEVVLGQAADEVWTVRDGQKYAGTLSPEGDYAFTTGNETLGFRLDPVASGRRGDGAVLVLAKPGEDDGAGGDATGTWNVTLMLLATQEFAIDISQSGSTFAWGSGGPTGLVVGNRYIVSYMDGDDQWTLAFMFDFTPQSFETEEGVVMIDGGEGLVEVRGPEGVKDSGTVFLYRVVG
jgi:hypothetical protein